MNKITGFTEKQKETLVSIQYLNHTYLVPAAVLYTDSIYINRKYVYDHLMLPPRISVVLCTAATPPCDCLVCSCLLLLSSAIMEKGRIWDQRKGMLGPFWQTGWDCEFQWTSKSTWGFMFPQEHQELLWDSCSPKLQYSSTVQGKGQNIFPFLLINMSHPLSIDNCALRLTPASIKVMVTGIAIHAIPI